MTSIRQQVFDYINITPDIPVKEVLKAFKECPSNTIRTYYKQHRAISNNIQKISIKKELIKIIKNKKEPGSTKVSALRFLKELVETNITDGEDPLVKLLATLEKGS